MSALGPPSLHTASLATSVVLLALVGACSKGAGTDATGGDAADVSVSDAPLGAETSDAIADAAEVAGDAIADVVLPPFARTLTTRPLMPTSPSNLLRDPFLGGDGTWSFGQFHAYFIGGSNIPLHRTFVSVSPVGGAVAIGELRDLPSAGTATSVRVVSSFLGGPGAFHASIWLSVGDASAAPIAFGGAAASIAVALLANDGKTKAAMTTTSDPPVKFGPREWVHFVTSGDVALPSGGWLSVAISDLKLTLQVAAPEVTSSAVTVSASAIAASPKTEPKSGVAAQLVAMTDDDRRAIVQGRAMERQAPPTPKRAPAHETDR